ADGNDELYVLRQRQADVQKIDIITLAADSRADVDALHDKVAAYGCQVVFAPRELDTLGGGYGFRFFSKDGLPFEISSDVARGTSRELVRWE
ncbi:MAG: VOC family protein, partial [Blastomonas fulva]